MTFSQRRRWAGGALLVFALLGGIWLASLDFRQKITTDVLDLVPSGGARAAPELSLVRSLASQAEVRTMFFELTIEKGRPAPAEAGKAFAAALSKEPAFAQVFPMGDTASRDALGAELFQQRFSLLFPFWLAEARKTYATLSSQDATTFEAWLPSYAAEKLEAFLASPEALAFQDLIPSDPLLLLPGAVGRLQNGLELVSTSGGESPHTLVWAQLSVSPLVEEGQAPAFAAIERTTSQLEKIYPGLKVAYSGVNRFAAASRSVIERELSLLNTLSLVAVLIVAFTFIRSAYRGLHLVPVVLLSILGAWVGVTMAFERVHILVFVVGSLLTGVAIDYGFYLYMQPALYPDEDYLSKVRRLMKPLLASCFTTVAGFSLLLFSDLPFIRQLGAFVGSGLISALVAAVLYFATVRTAFLETRAFRGGQALPPGLRQGLRRTLVVLWVASLPGLAWLTWRDDIRDLDIPSTALKQEDARIRALFGDQEQRTVYLTYGSSLESARDSLAKLESWLTSASSGTARSVSLGAVIPTESDFQEAIRFAQSRPGFPVQLQAALLARGFENDAFSKFDADYTAFAQSSRALTLETAVASLRAKLVGPLGLLLHGGEALNWFVTLASDAPIGPPPPETSTLSTGQLESLNRVFSQYRQSALTLSLIGLAIVGIGVFLTYGWRDGVRIFAIPCGACLGIFGLFGWLGHPLNLFHLLGAFLGVCLTHNYSIFSATSAYEQQSIPVSVRVSGLTTAASFGVLALSSIPVVRALGITVASMVIFALLVIELEHLSGLRKSP
ncbi:MAG TPA: MMPL family transporter [Opitutaceae bacterium]|nr:MMPL family transporter [Opitutaceae bacterium]